TRRRDRRRWTAVSRPQTTGSPLIRRALLGRVSGDAARVLPSVLGVVGHARQSAGGGPPGRGARLLVVVGGATPAVSGRAPQRLPLGSGPAVAGGVRGRDRPDRDVDPRRRRHQADPAG